MDPSATAHRLHSACEANLKMCLQDMVGKCSLTFRRLQSFGFKHVFMFKSRCHSGVGSSCWVCLGGPPTKPTPSCMFSILGSLIPHVQPAFVCRCCVCGTCLGLSRKTKHDDNIICCRICHLPRNKLSCLWAELLGGDR